MNTLLQVEFVGANAVTPAPSQAASGNGKTQPPEAVTCKLLAPARLKGIGSAR